MTVNFETDAGSFVQRHSYPSPQPAAGYPASLAQAVEVAVDKVDATSLNSVAPADNGLAFQSRTLLALLTFCYARQVYSSAAIAAQLRRDLDSLRADRGEVPDASTLLRFRRENQRPLSFCLGLALRFLADEKIRQGFVTHVKEAHLVREASRRIVMAMFTDSLELGKLPAPESPLDLRFAVACNRGRMH